MRTVIVSLTSACSLLTGMLTRPALGAGKPPQEPAPFACEIRFHFRENIPGTKPGEKNMSTASHERMALPLSRLKIEKGASVQVIDGRVRHLPYRFLVKIIRPANSDRETLEVNVLDKSGKSLTGFPQSMPNPLTRTGNSSRKDFEIPISKPLEKKVEKSLLAKDQFLMHVTLIIGMDDDFISSATPR